METDVKELKALIENSGRILVTSHISPDPDAVSSVLLMSSALELNFPDKKVLAVLEEEPSDLGFLAGYQKIVFAPLAEKTKDFKPELFILLDGNNFERASRKDGKELREFILEVGIKTAVIDHHEDTGKDQVDVFVNDHSPSTVQDVYRICFDELNMKKPAAAAQTAMAGFYADTGGFVYVKEGRSDKVFGFAAKLVDEGADVEAVKYHMDSYRESDMAVIGELARNLSHESDFTYSFLKDDFISGWIKEGRSHLELQRGANAFMNGYIRNIDGRRWGFIVYKNSLEGTGVYSASFRSEAGQPDVSLIAGKLGGGGHKPAAGARFEASSVSEALHKVKAAIASS
jgi:bifunctional oligoribonuclease and PAP phosphatase NrnA